MVGAPEYKVTAVSIEPPSGLRRRNPARRMRDPIGAGRIDHRQRNLRDAT